DAPRPSTAEVRAWARATGLAVPDRGKLRPTSGTPGAAPMTPNSASFTDASANGLPAKTQYQDHLPQIRYRDNTHYVECRIMPSVVLDCLRGKGSAQPASA